MIARLSLGGYVESWRLFEAPTRQDFMGSTTLRRGAKRLTLAGLAEMLMLPWLGCCVEREELVGGLGSGLDSANRGSPAGRS